MKKLLAALLSNAALAGSLAREVAESSQGNFAEFLDLLALDNVAAEPRDIQRNAASLEQSFRKRGFETQLLDNPAGRPALFARPLDPELRIFARSASDDKAPIMMFLTAIDLLRSRSQAPAFNIKVILDGEEEVSSPCRRRPRSQQNAHSWRCP
jgi:hypothetical protein